MKRIFAIVIALSLALALVSCAVKNNNGTTAAPTNAPSGEPTDMPSDAPTADASATPESTPQTTEDGAPTPENTNAATNPPAPTDHPAVERPQCAYSEYPRFDGSTANIPLAMSLIQFVTGCTEDEAEEKCKVSTTDYSYEALDKGEADMLLVYEASKPTKEQYDPENRFDMRPIGLDALVFIVNKDNPVNSLTEEQVKGIYTGEITNWKEVGGLDQEIKAFQRPVLSGSQTLMLDLVMKGTEMASPEEVTVSVTMADVIRDIAAYDSSANAIGYSVFYYASYMYAQPNLKFITINGVEPTYETINSGEYPYINPFYAILPKQNVNAMAKKIVDWLETAEGQTLVATCGYVPYMKGITANQ